MATPRICSVGGCDKPHDAHGFCRAHCARWQRHGSPFGGGTSPGEAERFYREVVLPYEGTDCLTWPLATNAKGYGRLRKGGRPHLVPRLVCEEVYGPPPTPKHEAAHSCGKGHEGCVNPGHLSWKTRRENEADKLDHGTHDRGERHPLSKLTDEQAREIKALKGFLSQGKIAERFGVSQSNVGLIHRGRRWAWL